MKLERMLRFAALRFVGRRISTRYYLRTSKSGCNDLGYLPQIALSGGVSLDVSAHLRGVSCTLNELSNNV